MMQAVVALRHLGNHRLWLRFDDGVEGELDFKEVVRFRGEALAPLKDPKYFAKAFVHPEFGTVSWPNGCDLDALVLYSRVTGRSIRELSNEEPDDEPPPKARRRRRTPASSRR